MHSGVVNSGGTGDWRRTQKLPLGLVKHVIKGGGEEKWDKNIKVILVKEIWKQSVRGRRKKGHASAFGKMPVMNARGRARRQIEL